MNPNIASKKKPSVNNLPTTALAEWEDMRGEKAILYWLGDAPTKFLDDTDIPVLYECLCSLGHVEHLDLILYAPGGFIHPVRQIAHLFRQYVTELQIFVPYRVHSAGTLLCLAATDLVLGPLAELSPLDPNLRSTENDPSGAAALISSEDVRAFRQMAESWFGLDGKEQHMRIFELLSQRFFPTALSSFYRADRQTRRIGEELLAYQLPESDLSTRQKIIDQLVSGYDSHDYIITRKEAHELGLRTRSANEQEEAGMWKILQACQMYLTTLLPAPDPTRPAWQANGILLSDKFAARHVVPPMVFPSNAQPQAGKPHALTHFLPSVAEQPKWEVLQR